MAKAKKDEAKATTLEVSQAEPAAVDLKKPRHRSPNYPYIGLEKALERTQTIHEHAGGQAIPVGLAHQLWDYKQAVGDQTVAALKSYGLIDVQGEREKRQVRLTDAARRVIGNAPDRGELLKGMALKPNMHREIWDKYSGVLPSDKVLLNYLVWDRPEQKFTDDAARALVEQFRATIAFANVSISDKINTDGDNNEPNGIQENGMNGATPEPKKEDRTPPPQHRAPDVPTGYQAFPLVLNRAQNATLSVPPTITRKEFALLKSQIESTLKIIEAAYLDEDLSTEPS